jgi:hypothetical protein
VKELTKENVYNFWRRWYGGYTNDIEENKSQMIQEFLANEWEWEEFETACVHYGIEHAGTITFLIYASDFVE